MSESTGFKAQVASIVTELLQKAGILSKEKAAGETPAAATETVAVPQGAITAEMRAEIKSIAEGQIKPLQEQLTKAQTDLGAANEAIKAKDEEIKNLKASAQTVEEKAAEKARQTTAAQGVPTGQLPAGKAGAEAESLEGVRAKMEAETDPVKRGELAARARKLRGHGDLFGEEKK